MNGLSRAEVIPRVQPLENAVEALKTVVSLITVDPTAHFLKDRLQRENVELVVVNYKDLSATTRGRDGISDMVEGGLRDEFSCRKFMILEKFIYRNGHQVFAIII